MPVCAPLAADAPDFAARHVPTTSQRQLRRTPARRCGWPTASPTYHRSGCRVLAGLDDEPVPHEQAVEDGFHACEVCRPEDDTAPDGSDRPEAAVVDADADADAGHRQRTPRTSTRARPTPTPERRRPTAEAARVAEREQAEREPEPSRERAEQAERETR